MSASHLSLEALQRFAVGDIFIETGTYLGETVELVLQYGQFKEIHTIELNKDLYDRAVEKFKDNPQVVCHFGDSVEIVPKLVEKFETQEVTFWLDAHASGELIGGKSGPSPLVEELKAIAGMNVLVMQNNQMVHVPAKTRTNTIFIDDRRLLGSPEWGFVKENEVLGLLKYINPQYNIFALDGHQPEDVLVASRRDGKIPLPETKPTMESSIESFLSQTIEPPVSVPHTAIANILEDAILAPGPNPIEGILAS